MSLFNILVDISANTAEFSSSLKRAEEQISEFGESIKKGLELAGIGLGFKELADQFLGFAENAEAVGHASEKVGLGVDQLSKLQYAATRNGVAFDELTSGLVKFSRSVTDAETKTGEQSAAFAAMGISLDDSSGHLKSMQQLFGEVADKFSTYQDGIEKASLAQILFGKSGADLIPILDQGSKGLADLGQRAEDLGIVLSERTVKGAEEFNDKMTDLHAVSKAFWQLAGEQLLPTLTDIVDKFVSAGTGANKFDREIEPLVTGVKLLASAGAYVVSNLENMGTTLGAVAAIAVQLAKGNFAGVAEIWKQGNADVEKNSSDLSEFLQRLWDNDGDALEDFGNRWDDLAKKVKAPIVSLYSLSAEMDQVFQKLDEQTRSKLFSDTDQIAKQGEAGLEKSLNKMSDSTVHLWDQLDAISQDGARNIQGAFADFLFDPAAKGFGGLVTDFANALKRMAAEAAATDIFRLIFGADKEGNSGLGGILGSVLGGLFGAGNGIDGAALGASAGSTAGDFIDTYNAGAFGGGKAAGGPLEMGKWYVAGEKGPEPIWGGGPGAFATGYGSGGGAPQVNITNSIDARGASIDLIKALPAILKKNNDGLESKIITGLSRNKYKLGST